MNIDINKIAKISDITKDIEGIKMRLIESGELFAFDDNELQFVLMDVEKYEELLKILNSEKDKECMYDNVNNSHVDDVSALLSKVGRENFVLYYYDFKEDNKPEEKLPATLSINSRRSRASVARKIFNNNLNLEALELVAKSKKIEEKIVSKAREILLEECGEYESNIGQIKQESLWDEVEKRYTLKIGRLVKKMMRVLFMNESVKKDEVNEMLTEQYSKEVFNLNFPVLKDVPEGGDINELKRDANGYNRYYDFTLSIYGKKYLLCSQWVEQLHREHFERWLDKIEKDLEEEV